MQWTMLRRAWRRFQPKPYRRLSYDLVWIVGFSLLWWGGHAVRPNLIAPVCAVEAVHCNPNDVPWFDRWSFGLEDERSHQISFTTQNLTGWITGLGVLALPVFVPAVRGAMMVENLILVLRAVALNGAVTEWVKVSVQRVRPHVYKHPEIAGTNPAHYTSFFSGHSSFTAVCAAAWFFILLRSGVRKNWAWLIASPAFALATTTGILRIVSGRHFLSDVIVGWLMGALWAYWIIGWRPAVFSRDPARTSLGEQQG